MTHFLSLFLSVFFLFFVLPSILLFFLYFFSLSFFLLLFISSFFDFPPVISSFFLRSQINIEEAGLIKLEEDSTNNTKSPKSKALMYVFITIFMKLIGFCDHNCSISVRIRRILSEIQFNLIVFMTVFVVA